MDEDGTDLVEEEIFVILTWGDASGIVSRCVLWLDVVNIVAE